MGARLISRTAKPVATQELWTLGEFSGSAAGLIGCLEAQLVRAGRQLFLAGLVPDSGKLRLWIQDFETLRSH